MPWIIAHITSICLFYMWLLPLFLCSSWQSRWSTSSLETLRSGSTTTRPSLATRLLQETGSKQFKNRHRKQYHCSMLMESVGFQGFTIYPTQTHSSNVFCVKTIIFSVRMRSCWYSWLNPMACHWYLMRETARGLHFTRHSKGGPAVSANHSYSSIFRAYIVELFVCECRPS